MQILEAECVIAYEVAKEVFWFVAELDIMSWDDTTLLFGNDDTIALAKEPRSH